MPKVEERRKKKKFTGRMQRDMRMVFALVVILFIALLLLIVRINKQSGKKYTKRVLSQQSYVSKALQYKRGDILDRNNTKIASSRLLYNVVLAPKTLLDEEENLDTTVNQISTYFEVDASEIYAEVNARPNSLYYVLKKNVEKEQVDAYKEMLEKAKKEAKEKDEKCEINANGAFFEKTFKRTYPLNDSACSVIGFSNASNTGMWGLESRYNSVLNGVEGRSYGYYSADKEFEETTKAARDGNSIVTTLDMNMQQIVEETIDKYMKKYNPKRIGVLMMNPKNGEIYAMSSDMRYDLNNAFDLTQCYSQKELKNLTEEEQTKLKNEMWKNYCISDAYEPGSTFKTVTVSAALEENIANDNSSYFCDGGENIYGTMIRCVSRTGHGAINLQGSLMKSCNDVMMQLVNTMGKETFMDYENRFNFGKKTGIDLPGENAGLVFSEEKLGPTELATSSFGQGLQTNMVQIAAAFSSIINGGNYYKPHVVKSILDEEGNLVENIEPVLVRKTVSENTSKLLRKYLLATVEDGTGNTAAIPGYSIGGKTGTAQKFPRSAGKHLVSFIGACPMDDPEVVVYAIMDEPGVKDDAHSTYAQEVARDIMKKIFPFLNIYRAKNVEQDPETGITATATPVAIVEPTAEPTVEPEETLSPQEEEGADAGDDLPIAQEEESGQASEG